MRSRSFWRKRSYLSLALTLGLGLTLLACEVVYKVSNLEGSLDAGPPDASGDSTSALDAADAADATGDEARPPNCPQGRGPNAVRVGFDGGTFCVDETEVTNAQYAVFVAAKAGDMSGQPPVCATNTTYNPTVPFDPGQENFPASYIDWCDALAFCAWAGKRLCGQRADGRSEWYVACSHDGERIYPYGNAYDPSACNGDGRNKSPIAVRSSPGCVGGYEGVFDLSGNVSEWEDACDGGICLHRGGGYYPINGSFDKLACAFTEGKIDMFSWFSDVGIRCCAD
jgi:hypothetical protein